MILINSLTSTYKSFNKATAIWPYKEEVIVSQENLPSKKSVYHLSNYIMKTILSEAESCEEHNAIKYSPMGLITADLWTFLCPRIV